jgi:hypothetical protein
VFAKFRNVLWLQSDGLCSGLTSKEIKVLVINDLVQTSERKQKFRLVIAHVDC